jgi:hypothetical protein
MSDLEHRHRHRRALSGDIAYGIVAVALGMAAVTFAEHIARWLLGL